MHLQRASGWLARLAFRAWRGVVGCIPGGRITAFGHGPGRIGGIMVVNLDRQPHRLRRTMRELARFSTVDGVPLARLARRLAAVDARDGLAVAATADVDPFYRLGDQLHVQPDAQLSACFSADEPVKMTRQEVAVARSHIEAWKAIVAGPADYVLVLEDDVWFRPGAPAAIDQGWRAAKRRTSPVGPHFVYFSYEDAGGTALRADVCEALFRPVRGLWFLSGYVLSREGARRLLRAMPVVGPVDMWMNYCFDEVGALALSKPTILQRPDGGSENVYSVLPFLARAGVIDSVATAPAPKLRVGPVLAWASRRDHESLAMALSLLGLRVRVFDGTEEVVTASEMRDMLESFDALVDAPLGPCALAAAINRAETVFVFEEDHCGSVTSSDVPAYRRVTVPVAETAGSAWDPICALLQLDPPALAFPTGARRVLRLFRDDRSTEEPIADNAHWVTPMDDTAWTLVPHRAQPSRPSVERSSTAFAQRLRTTMSSPDARLVEKVETFPGNRAIFRRENVTYKKGGVQLLLERGEGTGGRPYSSGALASVQEFRYGRFEVEAKAAAGGGLVTGFFLHRSAPKQEVDIEWTGDSPCTMLANVYFNPGDEGAPVAFGYRGSPCRIELGFDATEEFHSYAIEWRPGAIRWMVDGIVVHERASWSPTPIPHLPMRLHANLWAPRSQALAGRLEGSALPATAHLRNVEVWE